MNTENKAIEFYQKACQAERDGQLDLAEVYYLQSAHGFEQAGGSQITNAANALNALALLRRSRGDVNGALVSVKRSIRMTEGCKTQSVDAEVVHDTTWDLVRLLSGIGEPSYCYT